MKDLEAKAKQCGIIDLNNLDSLSNASSSNSKGNVTMRDKLIRDKRIHEQNLVSLRKKITIELQLKKKELEKYKKTKENFSAAYAQKCQDLASRQAELVTLQLNHAQLMSKHNLQPQIDMEY